MKSEVVAQNPKTKKDTSKASAASALVHQQKKRDREHGRQLDKTLLPEIESLNNLASATYTGSDIEKVRLFIDMGKEFHRGLNWRKKSIQLMDRFTIWEVDEESDVRFEDRKFLGFFVDAWIHSMVELARKVHLSSELIQFWIKTLERATEWFKDNPDNIEWLDEIAEELDSRKAGKDTFGLIRRPVGRPRKNLESPQYSPERYI
jgi:hypothetical protein